MNSNNKLTSHHMVQLAVLVVLFVIGIIATAWVYSRQYMASQPSQTVEEILNERFNKDPVTLTEEEKLILQKRFEKEVILSDEEKKILEARFNKTQ